ADAIVEAGRRWAADERRAQRLEAVLRQAFSQKTQGAAALPPRKPRSEELGLVRMGEPGHSWSLHIERANPDHRYFAEVGNLGVYYRVEPDETVDEIQVAATIGRVVAQMKRWVDEGVPNDELLRR